VQTDQILFAESTFQHDLLVPRDPLDRLRLRSRSLKRALRALDGLTRACGVEVVKWLGGFNSVIWQLTGLYRVNSVGVKRW
ncbi:MAG TPA: hypothetical protein VM911_12355, partial [Pyrinomonadaceae bacterium]|nr:hypothetical protein [Pyrinomonadaceae bacterium]